MSVGESMEQRAAQFVRVLLEAGEGFIWRARQPGCVVFRAQDGRLALLRVVDLRHQR